MEKQDPDIFPMDPAVLGQNTRQIQLVMWDPGQDPLLARWDPQDPGQDPAQAPLNHQDPDHVLPLLMDPQLAH